MSKGFRIICNNCGNEVIVTDNTHNEDYEENKYSFFAIQDTYANICCDNCDNEVHIDQTPKRQ